MYQELVRALKAEAKAIKAVRQTQHFIYEMLDVSTLRILYRHKFVLNTVEVRCKNAEASRLTHRLSPWKTIRSFQRLLLDTLWVYPGI